MEYKLFSQNLCFFKLCVLLFGLPWQCICDHDSQHLVCPPSEKQTQLCKPCVFCSISGFVSDWPFSSVDFSFFSWLYSPAAVLSRVSPATGSTCFLSVKSLCYMTPHLLDQVLSQTSWRIKAHITDWWKISRLSKTVRGLCLCSVSSFIRPTYH